MGRQCWVTGLLAGVVLALLGRGEVRAADLPSPPAVAPPLAGAPYAPTPVRGEALLRPGEAVTLRILQVIPADGLSPGERLLNGREPILPGDHFLAEVIDPPCAVPALVGGTIIKVVRPGWFGRPGYVTLEIAQFVQSVDGKSRLVPWQVNTEDRQAATRMHRALLAALLGLEGIGAGASFGVQFGPPQANAVWAGGGAAVGLLLGLTYSSFQRGSEANLEPGDTFRIVAGTTSYRPVSKEWQTILYPAGQPESGKGKH